MKFRFELPSANLKSATLSCSLFLFVTSFLSFHLYIHLLHKVSIASQQQQGGGGISTKATVTGAFLEEFIGGVPRPQGATSTTTTTTTTTATATSVLVSNPSVAKTECAPFGSATTSHFEPTTNYRQSTKLPQWMKDYLDWHREQTAAINECNFTDYRFLILRCTDADRKCGGLADRLKTIPFFMAAAAKSKRVFMIRWQRPTKLEEFLIPNEINWSVPDWMYPKLTSFADHPEVIFVPTVGKTMQALTRFKDRLVIETFIQDYYGGSSAYYVLDREMDHEKEVDEAYRKEQRDRAGWPDYEIVFRDLFYTIFEPSPPVATIIRDKMESANLVPGEFSASQYRAFYAVEHQKDVRTQAFLADKANNALNCASVIHPGATIYFASDSQAAVKFASDMNATHTDRTIVTFNDEAEALHLDKKDQWKSGNVSDFYSTFVDILVMGEAKCMSHGVGGFGIFANILSRDPSCVVRHDNTRVKNIVHCKQWVTSLEEQELKNKYTNDAIW